jgi:peptide/nickel transport system permease protein
MAELSQALRLEVRNKTAPTALWSQRRYRHVSALGGLACGLVLVLLFLALFPQTIAPYDPTERVAAPLARPSAEHLLGANDIGQDLFSELIWGTRASLTIGLLVGALAVGIGVLVGLGAGFGSSIGTVLLLRLIDLMLALPYLPLAILLSAYLGASQRNVILVLALVSWAGPARVIRAQVLTLRSESYIEAARALGCSGRRILWRHIWPGVRALAMVQFILIASSAIVAESSLSFLGLGDPSAKSWGTMLYFARASGAFLGRSWLWWVLPTGIMLSISILSLTLVGYWLEKTFEPSLRASS